MDDMASGSKVTDLGQEGHLLSWGCGEFGQHGHGGSGENVDSEGALVDQDFIGSQRIMHVSCGASHTAVVTDEDEIFTWGNGNSGQLGCGDKATHTSPQRLRIGPYDSSVAGVACGSRHTVVWLENGRAYSCGNNFYAQLGYDFRIKNYKENQVLPHFLRPIMHRKVVQVSCGEKFTLFLFDSGQVAGCGANNFGQLGNGTRAEVVSPKPLEDPENIVSIAAGSCHSLAVTASGELYAWGMGRPCGSRRDDVLTPQRKKTRHSNIVGVAGGSSHSLALSANGTVYSWGGGMDGQLGHGEDVPYLAQPKALGSDALAGRVSQVVCGDSYSAALLADGSLYMWGKNSHVIQSDQPTSKKVYQPVRIPLNCRSVAMVTCGSWHTAAITGKPARQPLEEDSDVSEEEDDELDDFISMDACDGEDAFQERDDNDWDMMMAEETSALENNNTEMTHATANPPALKPSRPPYRLAREGTTLTLEEFYSATPTPRMRPRELHRPSLPERKRVAPEDGVQQGPDVQVNSQVMDDTLDNEMVDESSVDDVDEDSVIGSQRTDSAEETETVVEGPRPKMNSESAMPKTTMPPPKRANAAPQRDMIRSKTMGSILVQKKSAPKGSLPRVYDMSAMSGAGDADRGLQSKFVVDKHVAIQSRKDSPSSSRTTSSPSSSSPSSSASSLSSRRNQSSTKQAVATVSLVCTDSGDLPPSKEKVTNSLPIPKMTRAHTLYGPMRTHGKIKTSKTDSPPIIHPPAPIVSMAYKTKPPIFRDTGNTGKSKYGTKSGSPTLNELKHQPTSGSMQGTGAQTKSARRPLGAMSSSSQRKPVFSSAGSWRTRSGVDDVLQGGQRTPPGSPQQRKLSAKDL